MGRTRWVVALGSLAFLGIASSIYATRLGAGLIADSRYYLEAARGLLQGHGFSVPTPSGVPQPLTNWPPLFSASLAALGLLGLDLRAGARWLNAGLLGGTIALAMLAIRHVARGSLAAAILGGFLLATSVDLLIVYSQAGSEPLFLFFGLLGLSLLAAHIEGPDPRRLLGASSAVALAFLSRYPGVVLVAVGVIGLLLFDRRGWRHRIRDASVFAGISALPMIVWMIRNWLSARQPIGSFRVLQLHPVTPSQLRLGLDTVWGWVSPGHQLGDGPARILGHVAGLRWIALVGVVVGGAVVTRRWRDWSRRRAGDQGTEPLLAAPLLRVLATFVLLYLAFMTVSISFFDATIPLDRRLLSPVFVAVLILAVGVGSRLARAFHGSAVARTAIVVGCLVLGAIYADAAARWIHRAHANGLGYAAKRWQQSDVLQKVRALPRDVLIYTNGEDAVGLVTDRLAIELPRKVRLNTGQPNPTYQSELAAMVDQLRAGAVLVYLRQMTWRTALYGSETELRERLHLQLREAAADGSIYGLAP